MRVSATVPLLLALLILPIASEAQENKTKKIEPSTVVGTVLGKSITAGDVGYTEPLDPSVKPETLGSDRYRQMGEISRAFGPGVMGKFMTERKDAIEPTAEEYAIFQKDHREHEKADADQTEKYLAGLRQERATPGLPPEKARELDEQIRSREESFKAEQTPIAKAFEDAKSRRVARMLMIGWKTEKELYKAFGGRVTSDATFPKALDAKRRLFEQAEKKGDLKFNDPGVRHLFYFEFINTKEKFLPNDAKPFEKPPWDQ